MATSSGVTFSNSGTASNDVYETSEDQTAVYLVDVMSNDGGGAKTTLYSLDDGTGSYTTTGGISILTDLLKQDNASSNDTTLYGAKISIVNGKVAVDPGTYSDAMKTKIQALGADETLSDSFVYAIKMANGTLAWAKCTLTIRGANDVATITGATTGKIAEDGTTCVATGKLTVADVDTGQNQARAAVVKSEFGTFTVDKSGAWIFAGDNLAMQKLAAGQQVPLSFKVWSLDGSASTTVVITVTGTNDAPTVAAALKGEAVEGGAGVALNLLDGAKDGDDGAVLHADVNVDTLPAGVTFDALTNKLTLDPANGAYDHLAAGATQDVQVSYYVVDEHGAKVAQTATFTVTGTNDAPTVAAALKGEAVEGGAGVALNLLDGAKDGDDGAVLHADVNVDTLPAGVTFDALTNKLTLDPANGAYDHLAAGATQDVQVSYYVVDEHGAKVAQTATFTVTGTNDAPTVAAALKGEAVEGGAGVALNLLDGAKDGDDGAVLHADVNVDTLPAGVTFDALTNKLTLDPANGAYDHLAAGATQDVQVSYYVVDEHGAKVAQTATFTVTGTNDAAIISGTKLGVVTEDAVVSQATGQLVVSDKDDGQALVTAQSGVSGKYGSFSIASDGNWSYTLDNIKAETNALKTGDQVFDTFNIKTADGTSSTVSITVNGHTDPASLPVAYAGGSDSNDYDTVISGKLYLAQKDFNGNAAQTGYGDGEKQVLALGGGDDTYYARDGNDVISGGTGSDVIYGQSGDDEIHGDADNDLIYGGSGNDKLYGDDSGDTIFGGSGMDIIQGGAGADRIVGGFGADTLDGGADNDTFVFLDARDTNDIIDNFQVGADKLDFIDLFSGTLKLGTAHDGSLEAFSVNYFTSGANTVVLVDLDGNTANAEFMVTLTGHHTLTTGEFLL